MKRLLLSACLLSAALANVALAAPASPPSLPPATTTGSYAPHRVIVKLKSSANATDAATLRASLAAGVHARFPGIGAEVWDVKGAAVSDAVAALQRDPRVEFAEPDYIVHASDVFPHDPQFVLQWSLYNTGQPAGKADADIDAPEAWTTTPGATVIVGVIDSGVDRNHEDLAHSIFTNPGEIAGNGKDDDGNGYVDDVHGWDFVNLDNDPDDDNGHGTHVSGLIAAPGNNDIGIAGVCWSAQILPLKFLNADGKGATSDAILAIQYAVSKGARVINASWGAVYYSTALRAAIRDAGEHGVLFVAAAGNDGADNDLYPRYPASYDPDNVISVAATERNDALVFFSDYGATSVDIAAPGYDIVSTFPGNRYFRFSGTSMSCALVSGAAALLWSRAPLMTAHDVKAALLTSADALPGLANRMRSGGRLNLQRMLSSLDATPPAAVTDLAVASPSSNALRLSWTAPGDDGASGAASSYELRRSFTPINAANFTAATKVVNVPSPLPAGSAESFDVSGLSQSTTYYFALVAIDEAGNRSLVSNTATAATLGMPHLDFTPDSFDATVSAGATQSRTLTITNSAAGTLDFSFPVSPGWARLEPASGSIAAGQSRDVQVILDAAHLAAGRYNSSIILATNDATQPGAALAVGLSVTDAAHISVSQSQVDFGTGFVGVCAQKEIVLTNDGTVNLSIGAVNSSESTFLAGWPPFLLGPGESKTIPVFFCPSATGKATGGFSIPSNDPGHPALAITMIGKGTNPPVVSPGPSTLSATLYPGGGTSRTLSLSNAGGSDLDYVVTIEAPGAPGASDVVAAGRAASSPGVVAHATPLGADALSQLRNASIPARIHLDGAGHLDSAAHAAAGGPTTAPAVINAGNHISEVFGSTANLFFGNERMRGNIFKCTKTTNLKEYRFYLNPTASTEMWFLVYEGDTDTGFYSLVQISDLTPTTTGEGWYSSGDIQVRLTRNRYYLIAATFVATTEYFSQTSVAPFPAPASFGALVGVAGWNWAPYTIFPPFGQQLVTADAFNAAVAYYQTVITSGVVPWASASIESGTVRRGSTTNIDLALDASAVRPGDYDANVRIHSNDPVTPDVVIPVHMHVNDGADIKFASGPVAFGECFVGASAADTVIVSNAGTQPLNVTSMSCSDTAFKITPPSLFLNPGEITPVTLTFTPKAEGTGAATLTVKSNDPDEPVLTVPLAGIGRRPPRIAIGSALLVQKMKPDITATRTFSISNPGESALSFSFDVLKKHAVAPPGRKILPGEEPPTWSSRQGGVPHHGSSYSGYRSGSRREALHRSAASFDGTGLHVLVLRTGEISEIVEFLNGYPDISVEADFDGELGAPALSDLLPYDAVLVINDFVWKDAKATGDVLADYIDHGGAVVVSLASFVGGYDLKGRFVSGGYAPFVTGTGPDGSAGLGDFDSAHPIMTDVGYAAGDLLGITTPAPGAQLIANWNNGLPCVVTQKGGSVVGMNVLLIDGGYWVGDVPLMVRNALRWAAGVRWLRASPERGVVAPHQRVDVNLLFDTRELAIGTYDAVLRVKHNDPTSAAVEIPTELSVDSTRTITAAGDLPLHYALEANHPNPFNPSTTIAYDLAAAGLSRLIVYDVSGARIRELVNGSRRAGHYTVTWDGRDDHGTPAASGIYFYRLTSGRFSATRKMVLVK